MDYKRVLKLSYEKGFSCRGIANSIKILYHLLKSRADLHYPTVFNTQYEPSEWGKRLSDDPDCFVQTAV